MAKLQATIGIALVVVALLFALSSLRLQNSGTRVTGTVKSIQPRNDTCGKSKKPCTKFSVVVDFPTATGTSQLTLFGDDATGHDQPISASSYQLGQSIPVIYSPNDPSSAAHDDPFALYGVSGILLFFSGLSFVGGFRSSRRRRT